jgi:hypothetical protein
MQIVNGTDCPCAPLVTRLRKIASCLPVRLSIHPHVTYCLPLDGFSLNLVLEFSKIYWENFSAI